MASLQVASLFYMAPSVSRNFKAKINHSDGVLESISCLFCLFFSRRVQVDLALNPDEDVNVISCQ